MAMLHRSLLLLGLLLGAQAVWQDCSAEESIASPQLRFDNVTSVPEPVVYGGHQDILKTLHNTGGDIEGITAELSQYWKAFNRTWVRFLKIGTDQCKEHSNFCPLPAGKSVTLVTHHPALAWVTPYGWYRSKQVYRETSTGRLLGCVDMQFRYCQDPVSCPYAETAEGEVHI
mmetsp:Transcript_84419/g.188775  ORF Transcript_84419/g.188775 Transcript_84419/m.188775 type:complete len:172 (-) Transcript_84419:162-677(-)